MARRLGSSRDHLEPIPMNEESKERRTVARRDMPSRSTMETMIRPTDMAQPRMDTHVSGPVEVALTGFGLRLLVSLIQRTEYSRRRSPS